MSQRRKYVVTCVIRTDLGPEELQKFLETRLGPLIHNLDAGDLERVVRIKESESTTDNNRR